MDIKTLLILILPLISSWLTYLFATKTQKSEARLKYKEEKYSNLLVLLKGFLLSSANAETKRKFYDEQYRSWIYSSDDVIIAINKMTEYLSVAIDKQDPDEGAKIIGEIILQMRKELLGKSNLTYLDFHYVDVVDNEN